MNKQKRRSLPRGLRWKSDSPQGTDDPAKAFAFRQQFLEKCNEDLEQIKSQSPEMAKWLVKRAAEEYFTWKLANSSEATVEREKRIFKPVEKLFASDFRVKAITLAHIRDYQKQRRKHVSRTMRQPVTGRTVNYEMFLLRCVMTHSGCWNENLSTAYKPLREIKQRAGKVANNEQIKALITTALANEYWQVAMYCAAVAIGRLPCACSSC